MKRRAAELLLSAWPYKIAQVGALWTDRQNIYVLRQLRNGSITWDMIPKREIHDDTDLKLELGQSVYKGRYIPDYLR